MAFYLHGTEVGDNKNISKSQEHSQIRMKKDIHNKPSCLMHHLWKKEIIKKWNLLQCFYIGKS